jgi:hypothetical protein
MSNYNCFRPQCSKKKPNSSTCELEAPHMEELSTGFMERDLTMCQVADVPYKPRSKGIDGAEFNLCFLTNQVCCKAGHFLLLLRWPTP